MKTYSTASSPSLAKAALSDLKIVDEIIEELLRQPSGVTILRQNLSEVFVTNTTPFEGANFDFIAFGHITDWISWRQETELGIPTRQEVKEAVRLTLLATRDGDTCTLDENDQWAIYG